MKVKVGAIGEMAAKFKELKREGNQLVAIMEVPGAVPYEIVGAVNHREIIQIVEAALKPSIISFLLFGFGSSKKSETVESEDYY
jgi:hypothetical protein